MCNTVTIRYFCNHFVQFHRSTCRSVIWVTRATSKIRKTPKSPATTRITHDSDSETPTRGRTLERSSVSSNASPLPLSSQILSLSPAPKLVARPACKSTSDFAISTQQKCGPCQRKSRPGLLQIGRARSELPSRKKRKWLKKRGWPVSEGSPLKHELTVEELQKADDQTRFDVELAEKVGVLAVRTRRKSL